MNADFNDNKIDKGEIIQVLLAIGVIILIFTAWSLIS
jgi:hypothetical protein